MNECPYCQRPLEPTEDDLTPDLFASTPDLLNATYWPDYYRPGDKVQVLGDLGTGLPYYEGVATVVSRLGDDQYVVVFYDGRTAVRTIDSDAQIDAVARVRELRAQEART